jgi:hypothetical protein
MNTIATKLQVGTAACAIAAAATLVPVAAQAAPDISVPTAPVSSVLQQVKDFNFFWFGPTNPSPPPEITLFSLDVPILDPVFGLLGLLGKEICVGGAAIKFGGYGGITVSLGIGC